jgi:hypothetical protein
MDIIDSSGFWSVTEEPTVPFDVSLIPLDE